MAVIETLFINNIMIKQLKKKLRFGVVFGAASISLLICTKYHFVESAGNQTRVAAICFKVYCDINVSIMQSTFAYLQYWGEKCNWMLNLPFILVVFKEETLYTYFY